MGVILIGFANHKDPRNRLISTNGPQVFCPRDFAGLYPMEKWKPQPASREQISRAQLTPDFLTYYLPLSLLKGKPVYDQVSI